nr:MAG TPA: major capsid protein [Bacteriophage sp.]
MGTKYDFSGWATRNDVRCADGRTIRQNAFVDNDGTTVPLVWSHIHDDPAQVVGHALLENRPNGVYAYGKFNSTDSGKIAKELVTNGDIRSLSIYANHLKQKGGDVLHGAIREVSLVLAGANPEAYIDFPSLAHSEDDITECVAYFGEPDDGFELYHGDDGFIDEAKAKTQEGSTSGNGPKSNEANSTTTTNDTKETKMPNNDKTIKDVFDELTEEQKNAVYFIIGKAIEDARDGEEDDYEDEEEDDMKHNIFDNETSYRGDVLSHDDMENIFREAKRSGSLREAVTDYLGGGELAHADTYGVNNIDYLFPDAKNYTETPGFISREMGWVSKVMSAVHHTPFSRIRSQFANITEDEARAKGYIKGKKKKDEVFSLLKRSTTPQTVYKKQKLDRDDVIDITDFDVVMWIKGEMRNMLDEEIARAILVGDGRLTSDDDHIAEDHIRPIWKDDDLFTIKTTVAKGADDAATAKAMIDSIIRSRKEYKGSGTPALFTTEDFLTEMLLLEDTIGHKLYKTEAELATTLRVSEIVTVPAMENLTRGEEADKVELAGIIVNLDDYTVGADKGGEVNMFDDFDIDYNQKKYLIETRCSGALTKPFSAIAVEIGAAAKTTSMKDALGNFKSN